MEKETQRLIGTMVNGYIIKQEVYFTHSKSYVLLCICTGCCQDVIFFKRSIYNSKYKCPFCAGKEIKPRLVGPARPSTKSAPVAEVDPLIGVKRGTWTVIRKKPDEEYQKKQPYGGKQYLIECVCGKQEYTYERHINNNLKAHSTCGDCRQDDWAVGLRHIYSAGVSLRATMGDEAYENLVFELREKAQALRKERLAKRNEACGG